MTFWNDLFKSESICTYLYVGRTFLRSSLQTPETAICHLQEEKTRILVPVLPGNTTLPFGESVWSLTPGGSVWDSEVSVSAHRICLMTLDLLLAHWTFWKRCQHALHNMLLSWPYTFIMEWDNRTQYLTSVQSLIVKCISGTATFNKSLLFTSNSTGRQRLW